MPAPLLDLSLQALVQMNLNSIKANPRERVREIFGDAKIEPLAALFGEGMLRNIEKFFETIDTPVVLGYNLDPAQIPGVTIHLERSSSAQQYVGSAGLLGSKPIREDSRTIDVPPFSPVNLDTSDAPAYYTVTPPEGKVYERILPGLHWRDAKGHEYAIGKNGILPTIVPLREGAPLGHLDATRLEVITPWSDVRYREGAMTFDEVGLITVHGRSNRDEGLWLWTAVQHGLLKYRNVMDKVFGLQLGTPSSSDFTKADEFSGDNVWRRFISIGTKATWTWETPPMVDVAAFLLEVKAILAENNHKSQNPAIIDPPPV
jgi:hypothetical protein